MQIFNRVTYLQQQVSAQLFSDFLLQHAHFSIMSGLMDLLLTGKDQPDIGRSTEQSG
jgi:hypothetical protein